MWNLPKPPTIEEFKSLLRKRGLKATNQRIVVHKVMCMLGHASADQVTEEVQKNADSKVTQASVYNILAQLADLKIYSRRMSSNNKMYFDVNATRHLHLYDHENNFFKDVADDELMELVQSHLKRRKFKGYTIEDIDIQFICRPTGRTKTNHLS